MHNKLESLMGRAGGFIHDNPIKVILMVLLLLAFPISHLPQIKMDTSTEGFMHEDDPVLIEYNAFRAQFGRDERIAVAIKSNEIFTLKFLETLKELHEDIVAKVPYIDDVTSLIQNASNGLDPRDEDTVNSSAAFTQAYLTYGIGNTSIKVGRQNLPKALSPFAFSEGWNVFKNSFEAALVVNTDIPNTALVGAFVWRSNPSLGAAGLNSFTDLSVLDKAAPGVAVANDGVYMITAQNKSIDNLTLTGTYYYAPEMVSATDDVSIIWGDAAYAAESFNVAVQGGSVLLDTTGLEDTTAFGAKLGAKLGMFTATLAYSSVDDGTASIENVGTNVKTPLYTQLILNQNFIKHDSDTYVVKAGVKALGGKIGAAYNYSEFGAADNEYTEFDLTYKTKVFADTTTLFVGYVYTDIDADKDLDGHDIDGQNLVRVWGRYNF